MELIDIEKSEFVFVQNGEFSDPYYAYQLDGELNGFIYFDETWMGSLMGDQSYSTEIFIEMAEKIDELNAALEKQRKEFFGLI